MTIRAVVGIKEPDPRVYRLTAERIGAEPYEIVSLDNSQPAVDGARSAGWHAVLHVATDESIFALEVVIAS